MAVLQNLWIRGAKQRLGGVVLYQLNGQTLARELAPSVSNPRTEAQMSSRVRLANLVAIYRANRSWMRGAYESKAERESDYNAFVRANLSGSRVAFTKSEAAQGAAVAAPYQVTQGSLLHITHNITADGLITNLFLGSYAITTESTVGEFTQALLANNNGLVEGMQLSLIINMQQQRPADALPYVVVRAYEVLLDSASAEPLSAYMPAAVASAAVSGVGNSVVLNTADLGSGAACFVLSQTTGGVTRVSTQSLYLYGDESVYIRYISREQQAAAIASYGESSQWFLDSNAAGTTGEVPVALEVYSIEHDGGDSVLEPGASWEPWSQYIDIVFNAAPGINVSASTPLSSLIYISRDQAGTNVYCRASNLDPAGGNSERWEVSFDYPTATIDPAEVRMFLHLVTASGRLVVPVYVQELGA